MKLMRQNQSSPPNDYLHYREAMIKFINKQKFYDNET